MNWKAFLTAAGPLIGPDWSGVLFSDRSGPFSARSLGVQRARPMRASWYGQDLSGQHGGVFGAVQRHGGHRDAAGHLHGGQQGVQAVHRAALNGDADDGQHGVRGDAARQMGGHTRGAR